MFNCKGVGRCSVAHRLQMVDKRPAGHSSRALRWRPVAPVRHGVTRLTLFLFDAISPPVIRNLVLGERPGSCLAAIRNVGPWKLPRLTDRVPQWTPSARQGGQKEQKTKRKP